MCSRPPAACESMVAEKGNAGVSCDARGRARENPRGVRATSARHRRGARRSARKGARSPSETTSEIPLPQPSIFRGLDSAYRLVVWSYFTMAASTGHVLVPSTDLDRMFCVV